MHADQMAHEYGTTGRRLVERDEKRDDASMASLLSDTYIATGSTSSKTKAVAGRRRGSAPSHDQGGWLGGPSSPTSGKETRAESSIEAPGISHPGSGAPNPSSSVPPWEREHVGSGIGNHARRRG